MKTHWKIISLLSTLTILIVVLIIVSIENVKKKGDERFVQLNSLVHVGMSIDEASTILTNNGFNVGDKHLSGTKEYYQAFVYLFEFSEIPGPMRFHSTIYEVTNWGEPIDYRAAVRLVADLDYKITHID